MPNNEKTVQERHFRSLQNIEGNIYEKIHNSASQLSALLDVSQDQAGQEKEYVEYYKPANFSFVEKSEVLDKLNTAGTSVYIEQDSLSVYVIKKGKTGTHRLGISYDLSGFISPLLPASLLDDYIVFDAKDGSLIGETFPAGLRYKKADSLLQLKKGIVTPGVHLINVGGNDYMAFAHMATVCKGSDWLIVDLVRANSYNTEKNQLPLALSQLLLTLGIGIVIMLPWIKLFHMGNKDQLTVFDGAATVLISMLLMSLLVLIVFKYSSYLITPAGVDFKKRDSIPSQIITAYNRDLKTADTILTNYDHLPVDKKNNITYLGTKNIDSPGTALTVHQKQAIDSNRATNIEVKQVYWLDSTGMEKCNWTTAGINAPHTNFGSRDYFKYTRQKEFNWSGGGSFYVDQLISRTSNEVYISNSQRSAQAGVSVVGMSFTAKSLDNVVMPDGYQFAVIDSTGRVRYHSNPDRSLNENLVNEFADSTQLVSSLAAKSDTGFTALYYGKEYNVRIKAFKQLPYFAVVFENSDYTDARDTESYAFTVSHALVCLLLFLMIQTSVVFFASSKRSVFKKQHFETSWIGPKISAHHQYNMAIIANLGIIALLTAIFYWASFLNYVYMLLFSITAVSVFLNVIFLDKYKLEGKEDYQKFKKIAIFWLCVFVFLIDFAAFFTLRMSSLLILLELWKSSSPYLDFMRVLQANAF